MSDRSENMEKLQERIQSFSQIHKLTSELFKRDNVPLELRNEYKGRCSQYQKMVESLEQMQDISAKEEAREGLIVQEIKVIDTWIAFEEEIRQKI